MRTVMHAQHDVRRDPITPALGIISEILEPQQMKDVKTANHSVYPSQRIIVLKCFISQQKEENTFESLRITLLNNQGDLLFLPHLRSSPPQRGRCRPVPSTILLPRPLRRRRRLRTWRRGARALESKIKTLQF